MKNLISIIILFFSQTILFAQNKQENVSFTYAEFRGGYGVSIFGKGLKEKYEAGNFSSSGGGLASLAAYHKFKRINYLNFGIKYKSLGAAPAKGDNGQEMFFNYWGAAISAKYFPFDRNAKKGIYLQSDYFFHQNYSSKHSQQPPQAYILLQKKNHLHTQTPAYPHQGQRQYLNHIYHFQFLLKYATNFQAKALDYAEISHLAHKKTRLSALHPKHAKAQERQCRQ